MAEDGPIAINAAALLNLAKEAYGRLGKVSPDRDREPVAPADAITAILFAEMALEAFINELAAIAALPPYQPEPPAVATVGSLLNMVEQERGSTAFKYSLASAVLSGHALDKGQPLFQDFALLIKVRNELLHVKPEAQTAESGGLLAQLRSKSILAVFPQPDDVPSPQAHFMTWVSTRAAARWACNTAAALMRELIAMAPHTSSFRRELEFFYTPWCQPVT